MQLTCPTCQSGLQVPDGITAHVRCPACKTVFAATEGAAPSAPPPIPVPAPPTPAPPRPAPPRPPSRNEDDDRPRPKQRPRDDDEEDDDRPRKKGRRRDEDDEEDDDRSRSDRTTSDRRGKKDRDDDEDDEPREKKRVKRHGPLDDKNLPPEERKRRLAAFHRGMWGARLIQISILVYIPAVLMVPLQVIIREVSKEPFGGLLVVAGILGLVNLILGAIGIGLCISGPPSPGHLRYGISSAVVSLFHAVLLAAVVAKTGAHTDYRQLEKSEAQWGQVATQYESLSFYLAYVVYPDDIPLKRSDTILSFITGVLEMMRLILIMMLLGCLAQASGDLDLSNQCTRMAGRLSLIPGMLALGMLTYKILMIETGGGGGKEGIFLLVLSYIYRAINVVAAGILGMTVRTVSDVAEACEFPYQSDQPNLGG